MKAVVQRVNKASVTIDNNIISQIDHGLLVLLGITSEDNQEDIQWLSNKIVNLRIFNDKAGTMNKSVIDNFGDLIIVSQFTLMASTKKGNRPSYLKAANSEIAIPLYQNFIERTEALVGKKIGTGIFGADMKIDLQNDGPITIIIDSKNRQ